MSVTRRSSLNLWYACRIGNPIRTVRSDILTFEADTPFDFVCTNAFFGQFPPKLRPRLIGKWHSLLAPGGKVTVTPVRPACGDDPVGFSTSEAHAFRGAVRERAEDFAGQLDLTSEEIAMLADTFAARMKVHPVRSLEGIRTLFEGAGFALEELSRSSISDDRITLTGSTVCSKAEVRANCRAPIRGGSGYLRKARLSRDRNDSRRAASSSRSWRTFSRSTFLAAFAVASSSVTFARWEPAVSIHALR